ncbi:odorant receptor 13a-like isoform X1 [Spodoptera litura]|uniref:Odorant receptor n=1 Tax=Spodoptera litura TaxID=69820 RepID=A0A9J7E399_SPOLT|nr:odorant receptor 13a-like isoform X1 [Spodoptera litura]
MNLKKFLFENESVVGISYPSQYIYIKIVRFMLVIVGSWPRREIGEPEPRYQTIMLNSLFFCVVNAALFGSISYVYMHTSELSFLEIGHMYIVILMSGIDMTHKKVHLICHLFSLCLLSQMLTGLSLFNLIPMYTNYSSGRYASGGTQNSTFEHSLYFPYPFNTSTDFNGYVVACILHWLLSYLCSTWFCMFDLFLSIMVFHLWGHFKILINSLNNFPKPSAETHCELERGININAEKYSKEELVEVSQKLKECIDYHREIIQFTNAMSDVFGPMLFCYYVFHQTSGCLLLLECSQMTAQALIRYVPLTIILTQQLIQLSVIFELVGSESEKLKDAVYGVPWECMDASNRKVVAFFLMNVQEPVHIKALGIANVGVTSMAAILKTSMSYFTFLRSM